MKNEILDEPIRDSFSDFLEKGETILWEGQPNIKKTSTKNISGSSVLFIKLYIFITSSIQKYISNLRNRKTEYAITSKRILFQLAHLNKNEIHEISFSEIKNYIIIRDEENKIGTLFLVVKNPAIIKFDTYEIINHRKFEKRHQPTLENLKQINKITELIRQGIKNENGTIIKNEFLDDSIRNSFSDFLKKDENIVWKGSALDPRYAITPIKKNHFIFAQHETFFPILLGFFLAIYLFFFGQFATIGGIVSVIAALFLSKIIYIKIYGNAVAEFALSTKRILIKSNYSKQREIYDIPLSQLNNCIVVEKNSGRGTIFLALKNPEEIQFKTFTIKDNNEIEKQHQPTLENIENPQEVAKLIRQGIKNENGSS